MWQSVPTFWRNLQPLSSGNKCHISEDHSHNMHRHENLESCVDGTCCYLSFYSCVIAEAGEGTTVQQLWPFWCIWPQV
jgi:hypothetical protein